MFKYQSCQRMLNTKTLLTSVQLSHLGQLLQQQAIVTCSVYYGYLAKSLLYPERTNSNPDPNHCTKIHLSLTSLTVDLVCRFVYFGSPLSHTSRRF